MEENQIQSESEISTTSQDEPLIADNSSEEQVENLNNTKEIQTQNQENGESFETSKDPTLILGKFKSVQELEKAYEELQKYQGRSSEELGSMRKELSNLGDFKNLCDFYQTMQNEYIEIIERDKAKYSAPEYFQDPTFREIYKEALLTFGSELDTDRMISLLDTYVEARIQANNKKKSAQCETQNVLDSMTYSKNPKSAITPPKKRLDEMTEQEVDELLERLI